MIFIKLFGIFFDTASRDSNYKNPGIIPKQQNTEIMHNNYS